MSGPSMSGSGEAGGGADNEPDRLLVAAALRACRSELRLTPCANARVLDLVMRTGASATCCSTGSGRPLGA